MLALQASVQPKRPASLAHPGHPASSQRYSTQRTAPAMRCRIMPFLDQGGAAERRRVRRSPRLALALRGPARRARAVPAGSGSDLRWLTQLTLPARAGSRRPRPSRGRCADFARCTDIAVRCVGPGSMRVRPSSSADNCPVRGCRGDGRSSAWHMTVAPIMSLVPLRGGPAESWTTENP